MWFYVSNIASICSIVGLPIAIWQIWSLEHRVEATRESMVSILKIYEVRNLSEIRSELSRHYTVISNMISSLNSKGMDSSKKLRGIHVDLSKYVTEISLSYKPISDNLKNAMMEIEEMLRSGDYSENNLKETRLYINSAIDAIKEEEKSVENLSIKYISSSVG